jgi:hypothetical protein
MALPSQVHGSYSADVQMELTVNGRVFDVGQLGPSFVILRDPIDHPPADGEMMLAIDGRVKRWPVRLPNGVTAADGWTRIESYPHANGRAAG